ncbi:tRNA (guanine-N1)-methyltransferase [Actinobacteria bacterium IMCC26256]|nr:tRNA (guanine-N1)-methyltransferase [Actinobacteria bacterium IMCC26256]
MRIDVFTIFPEFLAGPLEVSLLGKARAEGRLDVRLHDPRDSTQDRHRSVDDSPFGGGAGMLMRPDVLFDAVEKAEPMRPLLLLTASGSRFDQGMARELAGGDGFSLICGRFEGVDQRVADHLCDGEISVGDYVLAGGESAALIVIEAVARLVPGVMGNHESAKEESFSASSDGVNGDVHRGSVLEYPQYTRPAEFRGWSVPEVLISGDHSRVERWRQAQSIRITLDRRPDLLEIADLTPEERALLAEFGL